VIREGAFADLVVFDAATIDDRTSYTEPTREPAGIDYVMINGQVVVDHGRYDSTQLPGQVIRKGAANA
jgi:N-acyl-D-aspartate/D-glutamate deacylase